MKDLLLPCCCLLRRAARRRLRGEAATTRRTSPAPARRRRRPSRPAATHAGDAEKDRDAAMLAFARCMRENGVDVPDPKPGEGERIAIAEGRRRDEGREGQKACERIVEDLGVSRRRRSSTSDRAGARVRQVHARARRRHARPEARGDGIQSIGGPGSTIDPGPGFQKAQKACAKEHRSAERARRRRGRRRRRARRQPGGRRRPAWASADRRRGGHRPPVAGSARVDAARPGHAGDRRVDRRPGRRRHPSSDGRWPRSPTWTG